MSQPTPEHLERLFAQQGIRRRHLYPWWYQAYRAIGVPMNPPVLLGLAEHLMYQGMVTALLMAIAGTGLWWLGYLPAPGMLPLAGLVLIMPVISWLRYRRIKRRIGL